MAPVDRRRALRAQVRNALARLYDPIHLRRHPLVSHLAAAAAQTPAEAGQALRQALLEAIESIKPVVPPETNEAIWRPYRIMQLRYVEALPPVEVQRTLGIAKTQYYCQHEQALDAVTEAFAAVHRPAAPAEQARHMWVLPSTQAAPDPAPRHVYLVPMASLAEVKRALAAMESPLGGSEPVVFVVDRLDEVVSGARRDAYSAFA